MDIVAKRVYEPRTAEDGYRVLVDRLWPRGVKKADLAPDEWNKDLAPSTEARQEFAHKPENFAHFRARYLMELDNSEGAAEFAERMRKAAPARITLLYAARDPKFNHAVVLKSWLEDRLGR